MPQHAFRAFVSCSFTKADREIRDVFRGLLSSLGFVPYIYDYQEIPEVTTAVRRQITKSDCLIALITRGHRLAGKPAWVGPAWVQAEIAFAEECGKPLALFIEDGVLNEGVVKTRRPQSFRREKLLDDIPYVVQLLVSLREELEARDVKRQPEQLRRHYVSEVRSITATTLTRTVESEFECRFPSLASVEIASTLEDLTPGLSIVPTRFAFEIVRKPAGTRVRWRDIVKSTMVHRWAMDFRPPLTVGDVIRYRYTSVSPNSQPFTLEEARGRIRAKTYKYRQPIAEAIDLIAPMDVDVVYRCTCECIFPPNYHIRRPRLAVLRQRGRTVAHEEKKRLVSLRAMTAWRAFGRWHVKLDIPRPVPGHVYYVYYSPPSSISQHKTIGPRSRKG